MSKKFEKLKRFIKLSRAAFRKNLSDKELLPKLRQHVHIIEKRKRGDENKIITLLLTIITRRFFYQAIEEGLLSSSEKQWCENILFDKYDEKNLTRTNPPTEKSSKDLLENIKRRRSIRSWDKVQIKKDIFKNLVEAAKWAPSSCNRQPWEFIITDDENKIAFLSEIRGQKFIKNAPYCIIVLINKNAYPKEEDFVHTSRLDAGVAIQNLLLMAEELGLGACLVNFQPKILYEKEVKKLETLFNLPKHLEIVSIIPLGKARKRPSPPGRKDTNDILDFDDSCK